MYIFIMRHGDAQPSQLNDQDRALTDYGHQQTEQTAQWIEQFCQTKNIDVNAAASSPYLRASQTLQTILQRISILHKFESAELQPAANKFAAHGYIDSLLSGQQDISALLIVSHMPLVSYLVDELCQSQSSKLFPTAGVVCIDYDIEISLGYIVDQFAPD